MEETIFLRTESDNDLERVIRYNIGKANQIRKELIQLESLEKEEETIKLNFETKEKVLESDIDTNEEEYQYYYQNILEDLKKSHSKEERITAVIENLPSNNNKNFTNIISRIKLELLKEIQELTYLKREETDPEFLEEIDQEVSSIQEIIKIIQTTQLKGPETTVISNELPKNQLIFLKTNTESIYAENDLYGNEEYFQSFKELLLSIEDGTFKNVKRFTRNNHNLKGVCEVKDFKTRIIFDQVARDKYVIIHIFIKKSDNDNGYRNMIENRVNYYKNQKEWIIAMLNNESYLAENQAIRDNIMNGLEQRNLIKTLKKG